MERLRRNPVIMWTLAAPFFAAVAAFGWLAIPEALAVTALAEAIGSAVARAKVTPVT